MNFTKFNLYRFRCNLKVSTVWERRWDEARKLKTWSADVGVRKERRSFCQRYIVYRKGGGVVGIGGRTERNEEFFAKDTLCTNGWWALVLVQTEGKESIKWRLQSRLPTRFYVSQIPSTLSGIWRFFQLVNIVGFGNWRNIIFSVGN